MAHMGTLYNFLDFSINLKTVLKSVFKKIQEVMGRQRVVIEGGM